MKSIHKSLAKSEDIDTYSTQISPEIANTRKKLLQHCQDSEILFQQKDYSASPNMDLEDFQDLEQWCAVPLSKVLPQTIHTAVDESLNTPVIEQNEFHFNDSNINTLHDESPLWIIDNNQSIDQSKIKTEELSYINIESDIQNNSNLMQKRSSEKKLSDHSQIDINIENNRISTWDNMKEKFSVNDNILINNIPINIINNYSDNNISISDATFKNSSYTQSVDNTMLNENALLILSDYSSDNDVAEPLQNEAALPYSIIQLNEDSSNSISNDNLKFVNTMKTSNLSGSEVFQILESNLNEESCNTRFPTLNFQDLQFVSQEQSISTPDVIDTVMSFKKDEFDLLSFINDDVGVSSLVSVDETTSNNTRKQNVDSYISSGSEEDSQILNSHSQKRSFSKVSVSSEHEPVKKLKLSEKLSNNIKTELTNKNKFSGVCFEKDFQFEKKGIPAVRRGRPPKRVVSITSESSESTEGSRYRELRDKNNEASRRSRINRKMKEAMLDDEAKELERKNIKLATQVEELEKLVSRLRNTLLHTVLKSNSK